MTGARSFGSGRRRLRRGLTPGYQQRAFEDAALRDQLRTIVSPDGRDGSLVVHQDVTTQVARLSAEAAVTHALEPGRRAWVQVARGGATVNGAGLAEGDGAAIADESLVAITSPSGGEVLLFDHLVERLGAMEPL